MGDNLVLTVQGLSIPKRNGRVCLRKILNRRIRIRTYGGGVLCKGTSKMGEGPLIRAVAGRLIKQPSAAVVKSYGSEQLWKRP